MDARQERAIRGIMRRAADAICAVLNASPERLPPEKIDETITDALAKEGVTEKDIDEALKG